MSETDLACNFQVIICHLAEPVNLVSEWGKSQLWIKPLRGENLCNRVVSIFTFEQGHIPSRKCEVGPLRGENPCTKVGLQAGTIPQWKILIPTWLLRKACRQVCVNTFTWGHILSRSVQTRFSKWGRIPSMEDRILASARGKSHSGGCGQHGNR